MPDTLPQSIRNPKPAGVRPPDDARAHETSQESSRRGGCATRPLSRDARLLHHCGAEGRREGHQGARGRPSFRYPEARCHSSALRLPSRLEWRAQELGRRQRTQLRRGGQAAGRSGRRPPDGIRRLRGHDSQGPIWRRYRHAVGYRNLGTRRRRGRRPSHRASQIHPAWPQAQGPLDAGAHGRQSCAGVQAQLAAHQRA